MTKENIFNCKYCGKKMHKFDFNFNNGYCGKCKEVLDWKRILGDLKDYNE